MSPVALSPGCLTYAACNVEKLGTGPENEAMSPVSNPYTNYKQVQHSIHPLPVFSIHVS